MPVHDWTRVDAGIFHDFHNAWILELANAFNGGLLPAGYYALTEQHAGKYVADLLALHASTPDARGLPWVAGLATPRWRCVSICSLTSPKEKHPCLQP